MDVGDALLAAQKLIVYFASRHAPTISDPSIFEDWLFTWGGSEAALRAGDVVACRDYCNDGATFVCYAKDGISAWVAPHAVEDDELLAVPANLLRKKQPIFAKNDAVMWKSSDAVVPKGAVGRSVGFTERARLRVAFPNGCYNFPPNEIIRLNDKLITRRSVKSLAVACSTILYRFLAAAAVVSKSFSETERTSRNVRRAFRAAVRLCLPAEPPERFNLETSKPSSGISSIGSDAITAFDFAVGRLKSSTSISQLSDKRSSISTLPKNFLVDPEAVKKEAARRPEGIFSERITDAESAGIAAAIQVVLERILRCALRCARREKDSARDAQYEINLKIEFKRDDMGSLTGGIIHPRHLDAGIFDEETGELLEIFPNGILGLELPENDEMPG
jgi:hypothetical protein